MNSLIPRKIFSAPNHVKSCRLWCVCPSPKTREEKWGEREKRNEGNNFRLKSNAFHLHRAIRLFFLFTRSTINTPSILPFLGFFPFIILIRGMKKQVKHLITWLRTFNRIQYQQIDVHNIKVIVNLNHLHELYWNGLENACVYSHFDTIEKCGQQRERARAKIPRNKRFWFGKLKSKSKYNEWTNS